MPQSPSPRNAIPFFVLSFFLVYIFSVGVRHELSGDIPSAVFIKGSGLSTRHRPSRIFLIPLQVSQTSEILDVWPLCRPSNSH
jgi:hypothetical protein